MTIFSKYQLRQHYIQGYPQDIDCFLRLGGTIDDAPGECFDKIAAFLGLGYPGGPLIEKRAHSGDENRFSFPKPMLVKNNCNMSFSGLKTAVKRKTDELIKKQGGLFNSDIDDICASFQKSIVKIFKKKSENAMGLFHKKYGYKKCNYAITGGVAANKKIKEALEFIAVKNNFSFWSVPQELCTDNAVMIAYLGFEKFMADSYKMQDLIPRPRWPLDINAKPMLGFGKRGIKV